MLMYILARIGVTNTRLSRARHEGTLSNRFADSSCRRADELFRDNRLAGVYSHFDDRK
jgi:hypothetical protein